MTWRLQQWTSPRLTFRPPYLMFKQTLAQKVQNWNCFHFLHTCYWSQIQEWREVHLITTQEMQSSRENICVQHQPERKWESRHLSLPCGETPNCWDIHNVYLSHSGRVYGEGRGETFVFLTLPPGKRTVNNSVCLSLIVTRFIFVKWQKYWINVSIEFLYN